MALRHLIFPAWLVGAVLPRLYNEFGLAVSGASDGDDFRRWPAAFSWLTEHVTALVPTLAAAAAKIYPEPAPEQAALLHYAALDLAWATLFAISTILVLAPRMLVPAPFNALYPDFKRRVRGRRRILIILGSVSMFLLMLL